MTGLAIPTRSSTSPAARRKISDKFARIGIPLTIIGYAMMLLFAATCWRGLG